MAPIGFCEPDILGSLEDEKVDITDIVPYGIPTISPIPSGLPDMPSDGTNSQFWSSAGWKRRMAKYYCAEPIRSPSLRREESMMNRTLPRSAKEAHPAPAIITLDGNRPAPEPVRALPGIGDKADGPAVILVGRQFGKRLKWEYIRRVGLRSFIGESSRGRLFVKFHEELNFNPRLKHRYLVENISWDRIHHPDIGRGFVVYSEFIEYPTLADLIARNNYQGHPDLGPRLEAELHRVVEYVTNQGIAPVRFSPSDIFSLPDGSLKLTNYGTPLPRNSNGSYREDIVPYLPLDVLRGNPDTGWNVTGLSDVLERLLYELRHGRCIGFGMTPKLRVIEAIFAFHRRGPIQTCIKRSTMVGE